MPRSLFGILERLNFGADGMSKANVINQPRMSTGNLVFAPHEEPHSGADSLPSTKGTALSPTACEVSAAMIEVHAEGCRVTTPLMPVHGLPFLDSPQVSSGGNTPRGPYCTGGGHGELVTRTGGTATRGAGFTSGLQSPAAAGGSPGVVTSTVARERSRSLVAQTAVRRWSQSQHAGLDSGQLLLLSEAVAGVAAGAGAPPPAASSGYSRSFHCSGDGRLDVPSGGANLYCTSLPVRAQAPIRRAYTCEASGLSPLSPPSSAPASAAALPQSVRSATTMTPPASVSSPLGAPPIGSGRLQGPFDDAGGSGNASSPVPVAAGGVPSRRRYSQYDNSQIAEQPHQPPPATSRHYQSRYAHPPELALPAQARQDEAAGDGHGLTGIRLGSPSGGNGAGAAGQPHSPHRDPQLQLQHHYHPSYLPSSMSAPMPPSLPAVAESVLEGPGSADTHHGAAAVAAAAATATRLVPPSAPVVPAAAALSRLAVSAGGSRPDAIPNGTAPAADAAPVAPTMDSRSTTASTTTVAVAPQRRRTQPAPGQQQQQQAEVAAHSCSPFATENSPATDSTRPQAQGQAAGAPPTVAAAALPTTAAGGAGASPRAGAGGPRRDSSASDVDSCCVVDDTPFSPASTAPVSSFSAAYNIRLATGSFCHPPERSSVLSAAAATDLCRPLQHQPAGQALSSTQQLLHEQSQQPQQLQPQLQPQHLQPQQAAPAHCLEASRPPPGPAQEQPSAAGAKTCAAAEHASAADDVKPQRPRDWIGDAGGKCPVREVPRDGLLYLSPAAPAGLVRRRERPWSTNDYEVTRKLYAGYASSVFKASSPHAGDDVVLKAYNLSGLSTFLRHQVLRELDIHARLSHTSIVHLIAAFKEGDILVMVQEYVRGGSLDRVRRKLGGRMTEFQAMHLVLLPLLNALVYLHGRGIVHRDIKPENLLFTPEWQLKLCDFGVSICLHEERAVTKTGSKEYMAPEVVVCPLKRGPEDNKDNAQMAYTPAVDVWSLGALMYEVLVGFTPFPGGPPPRNGGGPAAQLRFPSSVCEPARALVRSCLQLHPGDRPTVHELLRHEWVVTSLESVAQ